QGAQYVGMGMEFINANPELSRILANFDTKHNTRLLSIMKDGPEEALKETRFTQPAILFHSYAAMKALQKEINITPVMVAGHSLGEFSALVANGVLSVEDALHLVHRRGEFMIKAVDGQPFAMAAIVKLSFERVKDIFEEASDAGLVIAANFNTPIQTVISGSEAGVEKACEIARKETRRVVPLAVGGPFHTPLIEKAGKWLREEIDQVNFNPTDIPVIANVDAKAYTDVNHIKDNLQKQVTSSVLWLDSVKFMIDSKIDAFVEFGPKKVLAGMIKKIDSNAKVYSVESPEDIAIVKEGLLS
ncbi:MAG: ACP S-malonyltransferase, partial [Candidatus Cloacimonetes bacterium]|nr:ACP S-malonyltransferase [Candidatus Cloacimonadota bacterium]